MSTQNRAHSHFNQKPGVRLLYSWEQTKVSHSEISCDFLMQIQSIFAIILYFAFIVIMLYFKILFSLYIFTYILYLKYNIITIMSRLSKPQLDIPILSQCLQYSEKLSLFFVLP